MTARVVRCRECGYNLFGISPGSRCPECGIPADGSIAAAALLESGQAVPLAFTNRRWVGRIRVGAAAMVVGGMSFNLLGIVSILAIARQAAFQPALIILGLVSLVTIAAGTGIISTREPYTGGPAPMRRIRFCTRVGFVLCGLFVLSPLCVPSSLLTHWFRIFPWAVNGAALVSTFAALKFASAFAKRGGMRRVAQFAGICAWIAIVVAAADCLVGSLPIGHNTYESETFLPSVGDVTAASLLIATERFQPRVDARTVVVAISMLVSFGMIGIWSMLWIGLSVPAIEPALMPQATLSGEDTALPGDR